MSAALMFTPKRAVVAPLNESDAEEPAPGVSLDHVTPVPKASLVTPDACSLVVVPDPSPKSQIDFSAAP